MIPLVPYMVMSDAQTALVLSVVGTLIALALFGYVKGLFTGTGPVRSALQTALIGGLAGCLRAVGVGECDAHGRDLLWPDRQFGPGKGRIASS